MSADDDLSRLSLLELYREETRTQTQALSERLLALESGAPDPAALEACMRAAHSLKGAARIVGVPQGVDIAGRMEECFVAAQGGASALTAAQVDALLAGVDLLVRAGDPQAQPVAPAEIETFAAALAAAGDPGTTQTLTAAPPPHDDVPRESGQPVREAAQFGGDAAPPPAASANTGANTGAIRRVRADSLNRLLSLSGESLVESRWLKPFAESMLRVKRAQRDAARSLDTLVERFAGELDAGVLASLGEVRHMLNDLQRSFSERMDALDRFERRSTHIAEQLYDEALQCRMRPFGDATRAYPRIVRDLARSLGRQVRFSIVGEATQVDRDILDLLDAPLGHLLRNAIDHGVEPPDVRRARGKPAAASVTLEARHSAGLLLVSVSDDGPGVDLDALRAAVVRQHLTDDETAARLSDQELLEFLLLPGFSMRDAVTDVSGRGVGLDAVQEMVRGVRGAVRIFNEPGAGMRFVLQLPLTLSVIRSLLVEVGGEPYAFPLAHVRRTLELERADIDVLEGQPHFPFDGRRVGLVAAHQLLDAGEPDAPRARTAVVVVGGEPEPVGVAVDRFLGERMLVVQPLDSRLHKIQNIAAGALLENGDPVLIVDVEDLIRSVDKLVRGGQLATLVRGPQHALADRRRRVLVVDDSLTVRELERKLLEKRGYDVTIAVDGMDGWNAVRGEAFDLVVTDVDMPRMDGIELVTLIKNDPRLKRVPVMIVSYKDRDEDRRRGLDAGADYYLAKGSFHDEALLDAVHDLIGDARG
ncbi:hybrid sensor histidine kinase/response regulator [Burkholderia ubonensis]|uniref:hybrid sensor histidine kinase/response regulator n=1 Tax=Burkholderia ubonensis TaxID=101571 RepID=UPI000759A433|nr:hybrid sensor histidine kinase/response regulator [Burkholderia ubonensis]KVO22634.1 hybrid sensor histidine kinase/response regulator [Burkholderia ubonensis]